MKTAQEILYFDRYGSCLRREEIYGEKPLRWAYETLSGRICLEGVIKRRWFSRLYGYWADSACSSREIEPFLRRFNLDTGEFLSAPESFRTFNEFFYRKLKPDARPIDPGEDAVIFPADGRHIFVPELSQDHHLYAKGQRFNLAQLLGSPEFASRYAGGSAVLSRLCPTDYHRFHFPLGGECGESRLINGSLYSVNPIALSRKLGYILENKRQITPVIHPVIGEYLFLEIGATNVGGIVLTSRSGASVRKGDEKGFFRFGGSMVMTLFPPGAFQAAPDLEEQSSEGVELYARMGDRMGTICV